MLCPFNHVRLFSIWWTVACQAPLLGSSVRGILQAWILEWIAMPFSRRSSKLRDGTCTSYTGRQVLHPRCHLGSPITMRATISFIMGCLGGSAVQNLPASSGDAGSIPGLRRCPGEGQGNPFQYSCLRNPMDREAWWATVHGGSKEADMT